MMTKTRTLLALAATMTIGGAVAAPTPADARWRHYGPPAPIVGGLVAGAALGAALAAAPRAYHSYAYEPVAFGPRCRVLRERFFDGWTWRYRRVEDCY